MKYKLACQERSLSRKADGKYDTLRAATLVGGSPSSQTGKPIVDFNLALEASFVVAESILSHRINTQLDLSLKQSLNYHESLLHDAELSSSKEIIDIANQVENLKSKKIAKSGFIPKLKNGFLGLRVKVKELQLNSKYNKYIQKRHLLAVCSKYKQATDGIINPHIGWYNFAIPELNLNIVKSELIPIQGVNRTFSINEETFAQLVRDRRLSLHTIGNQNVVSRRELNQILKA